MPPTNIAHPDGHAAVRDRILSLAADTPPLWGTMTAGTMLVHCADQVRVCTGDKPVTLNVPSFLKPVLWLIVMRLIRRFPRNMKTLPELDPAATMTPPVNFDDDRHTLLAELDPARHPPDRRYPHPLFGTLTRTRFGEVAGKHLDHHLRQFGR